MFRLLKRILSIALIIIILLVVAMKSEDIYKIVLKKLYPTTYSEYVYTYSEKYEVDSNWIFAIIKAESNFEKDSISSSGAIGLMQLMEDTADEVAEEIGLEDVDLTDPETNIEIGTKYFTNLLKYYDNNYNLAIAAYNAGIGNVKTWIDEGIINEDGSDIENIPYNETNNYVRKILNNYKIYEELY